MRFVAPSNRPAIRPGIYPGILIGIEERENERGRFLLWEFEIRVKSGTTTLKGATSTKFGAGAKARAWVEALLRRPLTPGEELERDDLLGLPCQVVVRERVLADGTTVVSVEQVLPAGETERGQEEQLLASTKGG